ncbi:FHA domain-containing protein [Haliangium sp.]|uniref:FHA domain-containing protein n=1 Tax=Haliangium sp. TaxID=2663208 RepID=UPI003D098CAB
MEAAGQTEAKTPLLADRLDRIASAEHICQEQILSPPLGEAGAGLVDQWGRLHRLGTRTVIGRRPGQDGIFILESSISREHAEIYFDDEASAWFIRDLGSKNGTLVNDDTISEPTSLSSGDAVFFGQVGFYFFIPVDGALLPQQRTQRASETIRADQGVRPPLAAGALPDVPSLPAGDDDESTFVGLPHMEMRLIEPSGGGGGFLETGDKQVQLTATQFAFLQVLARRMLAESDRPEPVRGFIRSSELLADLPWDTPHPEENHLKQLVRRVRRSLTRAGMGNLVESRRGFGYRLRIIPETDA